MTSYNSPGIYRITCTPTGRFYVGSAICICDRWDNHRSELRRGIHHNRILQRAWVKYGETAFVFEVLEFVLIPEMLIVREQHYLDALGPFGKNGFNIERVAGSCLGRIVTPEHRAKLSLAHTGKKLTAEHRENIRNARLGKKMSPETIEKMRNRIVSAETRAKIGDAHRGKTISPQQIEQMRAARLGKPSPNRGKPGSNLGKKFSHEHKAKLSEAASPRMKTLIVTSPDGTEYMVHGVSGFCKEHSIHYSHLLQVAKGRRNHTQGWKARYPD